MSMTPDPYRNAYEKALADLTIISDRFESLNNRKKLVENLVSALQPVFASSHQAAPRSLQCAECNRSGRSAGDHCRSTKNQTPRSKRSTHFLMSPLPSRESDGDPFERRVKANFRFRGSRAQRSF